MSLICSLFIIYKNKTDFSYQHKYMPSDKWIPQPAFGIKTVCEDTDSYITGLCASTGTDVNGPICQLIKGDGSLTWTSDSSVARCTSDAAVLPSYAFEGTVIPMEGDDHDDFDFNCGPGEVLSGVCTSGNDPACNISPDYSDAYRSGGRCSKLVKGSSMATDLTLKA